MLPHPLKFDMQMRQKLMNMRSDFPLNSPQIIKKRAEILRNFKKGHSQNSFANFVWALISPMLSSFWKKAVAMDILKHNLEN